MVTLLLHVANFCFWCKVFHYLYFRNRAAIFVKICNIYANQMVIKVATSIISSDKLTELWQLKGSVKEPNMFCNHETEKITRKATDVAENLQLYRVVRFFHPRSSCTTHLMLFSNIHRYMHCMRRAWWSRVEEPNNSIYCRFSAASLALWVIFIRWKPPPIYALRMSILGRRSEQHVIIGCGELAAVD